MIRVQDPDLTACHWHQAISLLLTHDVRHRAGSVWRSNLWVGSLPKKHWLPLEKALVTFRPGLGIWRQMLRGVGRNLARALRCRRWRYHRSGITP